MEYAEREGKYENSYSSIDSYTNEQEIFKGRWAVTESSPSKIYYNINQKSFFYRVKAGDDLEKIAKLIGLSSKEELLHYSNDFKEGIRDLEDGEAIQLKEIIFDKLAEGLFEEDYYLHGNKTLEYVYLKEEKRIKKVILSDKYVPPILAPTSAEQGSVHHQLLDGKYYYSVKDGEGIESVLKNLYLSLSDIDFFIENSNLTGFTAVSSEIIDQYGQERFLQKGEALELRKAIIDRLPSVLKIPRLHGDKLLDKSEEGVLALKETADVIGKKSLHFEKENSQKKEVAKFASDKGDKVNYDYEEVNQEFLKVIQDNNEKTGDFAINFTQAIGYERVVYVYVKFGGGFGMAVNDGRKFQVGSNIHIGGEFGVDAKIFKSGVEFIYQIDSIDSYNSLEEYLSNLHWRVMQLLHENKLISQNTLHRFHAINKNHLEKGFTEITAKSQNLSASMEAGALSLELGGSQTTYERHKNDDNDHEKVSEAEYAKKVGLSPEKLKKHRERAFNHQKSNNIEVEKDREVEQFIEVELEGFGKLKITRQVVDNNPNSDNNGNYLNLCFDLDKAHSEAFFLSMMADAVFSKDGLIEATKLAGELSKGTKGDAEVAKKACEYLRIELESMLHKAFKDSSTETKQAHIKGQIEWNFVKESGSYKQQYRRINSVIEAKEGVELKTPSGAVSKTQISAKGKLSHKEKWASDTLSYVSTVYNACMGEAESDAEKEIMQRAYTDNLAPQYWERRKSDPTYAKAGDKKGWGEMRADHDPELQKICENFFMPLLNYEAVRKKRWTEIPNWSSLPLMTVKPKFMETYFGEKPEQVFGASESDDLKLSGKWLWGYYKQISDKREQFSSSNAKDPNFMNSFEEHILFNLYIDREEYAFEYWNTPLTK